MMSSHSFSKWRAGFTLIEVMVSLAMLAIVITAVFSQMFTIAKSTGLNREQSSARALSMSLLNAFTAAPFEKLRTTQLGWSLGRFCPAASPTVPPTTASVLFPAGDANVPMTDDPAATFDRCLLRYTSTGAVGLGLLDSPTGLRDLRVWVEYYRGSDYDVSGDGVIQTTALAGEIGLIDSPPASLFPLMIPPVSYQNHSAQFQSASLVPYQLAGTPKDQADPEGTILIRVVFTYRIGVVGANPEYFMTSFVVCRRR